MSSHRKKQLGQQYASIQPMNGKKNLLGGAEGMIAGSHRVSLEALDHGVHNTSSMVRIGPIEVTSDYK